MSTRLLSWSESFRFASVLIYHILMVFLMYDFCGEMWVKLFLKKRTWRYVWTRNQSPVRQWREQNFWKWRKKILDSTRYLKQCRIFNDTVFRCTYGQWWWTLLRLLFNSSPPPTHTYNFLSSILIFLLARHFVYGNYFTDMRAGGTIL